MSHDLPPYEDPATLRGRLRLGREEFCQRLLTTLILGGYYPRWNTPHSPSTAGEAFLHRLHQLAGLDGWGPGAMFVDEFDLPARTPDERGGAPDWVVRWPNRLWVIELKTEAGSHRPGQLQTYATLARHHHPESRVDLTYLTPPLRATVPPLDDGTPVIHLLWTEVVPLVAEMWGTDSHEAVRRTQSHVCELLLALDQPLSEWRSLPPAADPTLTEMVDLARLTAQDGTQRAIESPASDLQGLHDKRLELRAAVQADPATACVRPWVWSASTSGGRPLTRVGAETGFELRLSRYGENAG